MCKEMCSKYAQCTDGVTYAGLVPAWAYFLDKKGNKDFGLAIADVRSALPNILRKLLRGRMCSALEDSVHKAKMMRKLLALNVKKSSGYYVADGTRKIIRIRESVTHAAASARCSSTLPTRLEYGSKKKYEWRSECTSEQAIIDSDIVSTVMPLQCR